MSLEDKRLYNNAAEAAVCGSMMLDDKTIPDILNILNPRDFYFPKNCLIFKVITRVWYRDFTVDGLLVRNELDACGELDLDYFMDVLNTTPTAANAVYYAKGVLKAAYHRRVVVLSSDLQKISQQPDPPQELVEAMQSRLAQESVAEEDTLYEMREVIKMSLKVELATEKKVLKTEFWTIDEIIGGLSPKELIILAGRPSMGKTALAICMALNIAAKNKRVLFSTLEMGAQSIGTRMVQISSGIGAKEIYPGADPACANTFIKSAEEIENYPIVFVEQKYTVPLIETEIQRQKIRDKKPDLVIIDYLQLMSQKKSYSRQQEISEISMQLKRMAVHFDLPVLVLSQLNRGVEGRTSKRPALSDLRESGALEQDADKVLMVYREDYYRSQKEGDDAKLDGFADVIINKNRNGPCGVAKMIFIPKTTKFRDRNYSDCGLQ